VRSPVCPTVRTGPASDSNIRDTVNMHIAYVLSPDNGNVEKLSPIGNVATEPVGMNLVDEHIGGHTVGGLLEYLASDIWG